MKRNDPISHLMTKEVETVQVGQKISEVRKLLAKNNFHHVPVLDGKQLVGILSTADVLKMSFEAYGSDPRTMDVILDKQFTIKQVMRKELTTLHHKDTVRSAVELLVDGKFHSLPVIDDNRNLVGIVTSTDLIRYLGNQY